MTCNSILSVIIFVKSMKGKAREISLSLSIYIYIYISLHNNIHTHMRSCIMQLYIYYIVMDIII